jgi:magnesium transporter
MMKLKEILVDGGDTVTYNTDPLPSSNWLNDGHIHWLNVSGASLEELAELFNTLGVKGKLIVDHIDGDDWIQRMEGNDFYFRANAAPTAWFAFEKWYYMVVISNIIITIHKEETPEMEKYIERWWLKSSSPEPKLNNVLMHIVKMFVSEEVTFYNKLRLDIEKHAEGLRLGDEDFTVEQLEVQMTQCYHMSTVFYEYQVLLQSMEFNTDKALASTSFSEHYRTAAQLIGTLREGVESIQSRLEELQKQHLMDKQVQTEQRLRILTIVSAIFMPLALIPGLYGMNLEFMPDMHGKYAYYEILGVMGAMTAAMIGFFMYRGWFR